MTFVMALTLLGKRQNDQYDILLGYYEFGR
jgi:hypothetical protein